MSKPFMMLYIGDHLADTTHLSTERHGAFLLLLFGLWRRDGYLPSDDKVLAKVAGLTLGKWRAIAAPIMALMDIEDGQITQRRLLSELQKVNAKSQKAFASGALKSKNSKHGKLTANRNFLSAASRRQGWTARHRTGGHPRSNLLAGRLCDGRFRAAGGANGTPTGKSRRFLKAS